MKILVTGGQGFIGSHLVDELVKEHEVVVLDNYLSGDNCNHEAKYFNLDIRNYANICDKFKDVNYVFHLAAIARTPWTIRDPILCHETNITGTLNVLQASKSFNICKVILSSSNIVYAAETPYKVSKLTLEMYAKVYNELYNLPTVCLRYSNVYGKRQREDGESPNVFASFRKSKRENGYITITGDGEQSRDFTHVSDIVRANMLAMQSSYTGILDVCTGRNVTMNYVAGELFKAKIKYVTERKGDIKHIVQDIKPIKDSIGWEATIKLEDGIMDCYE